MNDIELTELFVDYANLQDELAEIKEKITAEVLKRGETVKIAGVTASYYKPSFGTPDYEGAIHAWQDKHPEDTGAFLGRFTTITTTYKWKEACEYLMIPPPPPGEEKPARVVVK